MATVYTCKNERRRQLLADGVVIPSALTSSWAPGATVMLNGIDYLEVLDTVLKGEALVDNRQRYLVIRCLQPLYVPTTALPPVTGYEMEISAENVLVEGGVRITGIEVVWAMRADELIASGPPVAETDPTPGEEQAWFASYIPSDEQTRTIVVKVDARGDHSTYTLTLTKDDGTTALDGFDRVLNTVDFAFKVECVTDLDCATTTSEEEEEKVEPRIDYLARDYRSFRKLMLDRLSVVAPDWEERNPADLGVTLVEILAYAADQLSYYQDAVATEAYLETARRRTSVRRHARLLDYPMHDGCNARTWVHLAMVEGQTVGSEDDPALPSGSRLLTWVTNNPVLTSEGYETALLRSPLVFETMHDRAILTYNQNEITIHTFGEDECCLPAGSTSCSLVVPDDEDDDHLAVGDVIVFEEVRSPETGAVADADPDHRHAVRITAISERYQDFVVDGTPTVVDVSWEAEDAPPFELCLQTVTDAEGASGPTVVARGNMVLADHGRSVDHDEDDAGAETDEGEPLVPDTVPVSGRYRPRLKGRNLTFAVEYDRSASATTSLEQEPRDAVPQIELRDADEGTVWEPARDLLGSDETASEFVVETEDSGRAWVRFGDDEYGRKPTAGTTLRAFYRMGNGTSGNVGADALVHVVSDSLSGAVRRVRNPLPAKGGVDAEPIDDVKKYAPQAFRTQKRAVTAEDWATVCAKHTEVQKAVATFRWTGSWYTVFLTVDRKGGEPIDDDFKADLLAFVEPYRLAGYDLEITSPRMVPLHLALSVCVESTYYRATVKSALLRALGTGLLEDGSKAFFHPDNLTFGQSVYLSPIIAAIMKVPGVAWVDATPNALESGVDFIHRFHRLHEQSTDGLRPGYLSVGALEIARLDNDPNYPEYGQLELNMRGGL